MGAKIFLKMASWKLFAYLFFIPALMIIHNAFAYDPANFHKHAIIEMALLNVFMIVYGIWFFALCKALDMRSAGRRLSSFLGYNFIALILYTIIMNYLVFGHFIKAPEELIPADDAFFDSLVPIIIFAQIYSTLLYLLTLQLLAKAMATKEIGRPAAFKDYALLIVLFIVSPIGIWFIQARIRRLFAE